jgi:ribosomal protein S18 acetylase RimI-like enzyme
MRIVYEWRGGVTSTELNELHAEAFGHRLFTDAEWDWLTQIQEHSLGWATARDDEDLVGFLNVITDGLVHAWIQDVIVARSVRHMGIGRSLVETAIVAASATDLEWLHVDFDDDLKAFCIDACGFEPSNAGLMDLTRLGGDR